MLFYSVRLFSVKNGSVNVEFFYNFLNFAFFSKDCHIFPDNQYVGNAGELFMTVLLTKHPDACKASDTSCLRKVEKRVRFFNFFLNFSSFPIVSCEKICIIFIKGFDEYV